MGKAVIAIHGGAGAITRSALTPERERQYVAALSAIVDSGQKMLAAGASALDTVTEAVRLLEECPLFNAGIGSVFTRDATHELDACVMDGNRLQAGAVAGVKHVRNPVLAARLVLEQSPHVLLIGEGAEAFAVSHGMERVENHLFSTTERLLQLQQAQADNEIVLDHRAAPLDERHKMGTVGAVALDLAGIILAAAGLGFLGLGARPPMAEWGAMIADGMQVIFDQWWIAAAPGAVILIASLAFNLLGDGLRDVLEPQHD